MSHEIRTPMNAIIGMDEMILRSSPSDTIKKYALDIQSAGKTLLSIINDILDFSKIESGKMEIVPVDYDLASLLNDLVNITKVRIDAKGLELKVEIDPDIPRNLFGDEVRLKQVVTNLLSNAAKYTEKGTVTLSVSLDKEASTESKAVIRFAVKDTGVGIRKEDIDKLFTEFERIDVKKNRNIEGTGLGMAISKNLLEMMGSRLKVESVYGEGSEFSFVIGQGIKKREPIGDYTVVFRELAEKQDNYVPQFTASSARVLMVDDLMVNLVVFKELLKKTQITVDTANSGKQGVELTRQNGYDILFLDHMMPEMDGIETLQAIRSEDDNPNVNTPAVCLTANAVTGAKEFYMENGFDDYLTKPINSEQLERMIYEFLPYEKIDK
jgi:CheY-like chemotaxis protein